ncbi:NADH-quinone oxidoreductase subunit C [bacterium]|nr:NADH-quinone oxidoreductase subunit C [bacterium]
MTNEEIFEYLHSSFPDSGLQLDENVPVPLVVVPREHLAKIAKFLRDDEKMYFECLMCLSGIEMGDELHTVYNLYSMKHEHKVSLRCIATKEDPVMPTVSSIWATADWHERESYDLMGITYEGHPDPRRILCPDDWEGHPLRKDYEPQKEWHGIPLEAVLPEDIKKGDVK